MAGLRHGVRRALRQVGKNREFATTSILELAFLMLALVCAKSAIMRGDPLTTSCVTGLLALIALLACSLHAQRRCASDPVTAIHAK